MTGSDYAIVCHLNIKYTNTGRPSTLISHARHDLCRQEVAPAASNSGRKARRRLSDYVVTRGEPGKGRKGGNGDGNRDGGGDGNDDRNGGGNGNGNGSDNRRVEGRESQGLRSDS